MIYFDNSATTQVHPEVLDAMWPYLHEYYGNPSGKYYTLAEQAKKAVENAREQVARLLDCDPEEIVFTSGATESNNMVLKGIADYYYQSASPHFVTSKAEHPSILDTTKFLETRGVQVTYLDVDSSARIKIEQLMALMDSESSKPSLVSILWGNSEVGSLNDVGALATTCRQHGIFFHTDATQVVGKMKISVRELDIQFLSCSSHKIHGPKGIGACVIKKHKDGYRTMLTPLLHGGEQENGYRSGTLSVHNIVGFGKAAEIAYNDQKTTHNHLVNLESYLIQKISDAFPDLVQLNSDRENKIPGIINLRFKGINNELLIKKLADQVSMSTGSACSSSKPSHVLQSMGLSANEIRSSVRISLSRFNSHDDVDQFIQILKK